MTPSRLCLLACLAAACGGGDRTPSGPNIPVNNPPVPPPAPRAIFSAPIAGTPMGEVFYGAYVDRGNRDFACGVKFYPGHTGTDILLRNFPVQDSGVAVLAAAPGVVASVRDGLPDRNTRNGSGGFGNFVSVAHPEPGLQSIYGHLRNGSIRVAPGAPVARGDTIALVGSSGNSNWPHLHFEVQELGTPTEPFVGPCNPPAGQPSWIAQLGYQNEFRVLDAGLTTMPQVTFADLLERPADVATVTPGDASFLVWLNLFNVRAAALVADLENGTGGVLARVQSGGFTTFSTLFFSVRFSTQALTEQGTYAVVVRMVPLEGGSVTEIARRTFLFDPGVIPAPRVLGPVPAPRVWLSPVGGDRRDPAKGDR